MNIGAIVLAAGGSVRMGTPKQLLLFQGKTLLRRAVEATIEAGCSPVVVVLGSNAVKMQPEIDARAVALLNPDWQLGMGTSIRAGVDHLVKNFSVDAILMTLCDQPLVDHVLLRQMLEVYRTSHRPMVAASYNGTLGVPAIFSGKYFPLLQQLDPGGGAKRLFTEHADDALPIPLDEAGIDVDTLKDYHEFVEKNSSR